MAAKRNTTKPDAPTWSLTEQQRTAIDLLVTGRNLQDTADAVHVSRPTVSGWLHHNPGFHAELNQRRQELWSDLVDGLRALAPRAMEVLAQALDSADPVPAAIHILKACGLYGGIAAPRGSTDPAILDAAQQLAA